MDYLKQPTAFKIRKVLRYVSLFGIARTRMKIKGQLHMRRRFQHLPRRTGKLSEQQVVGLIGCGNYAYTTIAYFLQKRFGNVIGSCMDVEANRAASLAGQYHIPHYTTDSNEILDDHRIRLVFIVSNHASHAEYAIRALKAGKHVYVEKPHVVSYDQLGRLVEAARGSEGRVFLGFNRPGSRFGRLIRQYLHAESGAGMYSWFVIGHDIEPGHWYFNPEEGGRVPGNLCHWTDFLLHLVPTRPFPVTITPAGGALRESDIAVTYTFPEGTIACITFSAKGHTFEGVRERFMAHKGNCVIMMDDFKRMRIDIVAQRKRFYSLYRDHGHERNICQAYENTIVGGPYDREKEIAYIANTGWLFLKTREALELNERLTIKSYQAAQGVSEPELSRDL